MNRRRFLTLPLAAVAVPIAAAVPATRYEVGDMGMTFEQAIAFPLDTPEMVRRVAMDAAPMAAKIARDAWTLRGCALRVSDKQPKAKVVPFRKKDG